MSESNYSAHNASEWLSFIKAGRVDSTWSVDAVADNYGLHYWELQGEVHLTIDGEPVVDIGCWLAVDDGQVSDGGGDGVTGRPGIEYKEVDGKYLVIEHDRTNMDQKLTILAANEEEAYELANALDVYVQDAYNSIELTGVEFWEDPKGIPLIEHLSEETIRQVMDYMEQKYNDRKDKSWIDADEIAGMVLDGVADNFVNNGGDLVWDKDDMIYTYLNGDGLPKHLQDEVRESLESKIAEYRPEAARQILANVMSDYNSEIADIGELSGAVKDAMDRTGLEFYELDDILEDVPQEAIQGIRTQLGLAPPVEASKVAPRL